MSRVACVIGSGAREHALAHVLSRSASVVVTPGSDAMAGGSIEVTDALPTAITADLFVIGPERPLVQGLADELRAQGKLVVGPGADGARLEGSKSYMKDLLVAAGVPTARHGSFSDIDGAIAFLDELDGTVVVKTDGLAEGKGVLVTDDRAAAVRDVTEKLTGVAFGEAGRCVVIEEGLRGEECSLLVLVDGTIAVPLAASRDYKRLGDAGVGPNTGGMGAVSPADGVDDDLVATMMREAVLPTVAELRRRGIDYRGVLYAGFMVTASGPRLLEHNVRFGDPETQVVLPRLADDAFDILVDVASGALRGTPRFVSDAAVTVVLASKGYPSSPEVGVAIEGIGEDGQLHDHPDDVIVFHAATRRSGQGYVTTGGRVLSVTALADTVPTARARAYDAVAAIHFEGQQVRTDIAAVATEVAW